MIRENSYTLPTDLVMEILLRLPAKSIARFRCVSKPWGSMIGSAHFTDLFRTKSLTRPRLLFAVEQGDGWCLLTSPQPHNPYENSSSLEVTADLHMNFIRDNSWVDLCDHASGLVCFYGYRRTPQEDSYIIICNPSTGQFVNLPLPKGSLEINWIPFLGYDPIDKQIKVLSIRFSASYDEKEDPYQILTLGTGNDSWRKIHCPVNHFNNHVPERGICIDGVLYYFAKQPGLLSMIVCFDVRSETFKFIYRDFIGECTLINYKGQLGMISQTYTGSLNTLSTMTLCMWVIKDVEKPEPEWSKYINIFRKNPDVGCDDSKVILEHEIVDSFIRVAGVTASGDIVLSNDYKSPFYVFYLNPEKKTLQRVEIQGLGAADHGPFEKDNRRVKVFVDHIEDLKVMKVTTYAETSIGPSKTEASNQRPHQQHYLKLTYNKMVVRLRALKKLIL